MPAIIGPQGEKDEVLETSEVAAPTSPSKVRLLRVEVGSSVEC